MHDMHKAVATKNILLKEPCGCSIFRVDLWLGSYAVTILNDKLNKFMIFVEVKDNEGVDRALKRFKKKVERVGILKEARQRMAYTKPTVSRKAKKLKAMHKYRMLFGHNG